MRAAVLVAALLSLAACQTPCPPTYTGPETVQLRCEDGSELTVTFSRAPDVAVVAQEGYTTLTLPARITGSGYRYVEGGSELRARGTQVGWTRTGTDETICAERSQQP